jgi:FkbM family methyltransferase
MKSSVIRRVLLFVLIALVIATGVRLGFRGELKWSKTLFKLERNGCPLPDAISAIRYTTRQRALYYRLTRESRVIESDPTGFELWQTPLGKFWAPRNDGPSLLFVLAEVEEEPYASPRVRVSQGDVVLDCGAQVGTFTKKALEAGAGRVVCIEPDPKYAVCLRRNYAAEVAAGRVVVAETGVWDKEGQLVFHEDGATSSFVMHNANLKAMVLPVTTIDKLVPALGLARVDFIKMDIEGAELQALAGAAGTLARFTPKLAIASYHKAEDPTRIPALVHSLNSVYGMESVGCRLDMDQIRPLSMFFYSTR